VRIVSLLPSTTEILFAVGAGDDVVGVTFECDHPAAARTRRIVSTTSIPSGLTPAEIDTEVRTRVAAGEDLYHLDEGALREIDADLVLTQDLCAVCAIDVQNVDDALAHLGCRAQVLTIDPMTLDDVLASIETIGVATGCGAQGRTVVAELRERLAAVDRAVGERVRPRVAVLEWTDPPFSSGHWVPDMVDAAGATSVLGTAGSRSTRIQWDDITRARPDIVVVAPCGYQLAEAVDLARDVCDRGVVPDGVPVWAVDANNCFVRPGPRVVDGVEALAAIAHPGMVPERPDVATRLRSPRPATTS
jgi:iron complex transport system substrate-binding protein